MHPVPIEILILEKNKERKRSEEQPQIQLPMPEPPVYEEPIEVKEDENRGVVILDIFGDDTEDSI